MASSAKVISLTVVDDILVVHCGKPLQRVLEDFLRDSDRYLFLCQSKKVLVQVLEDEDRLLRTSVFQSS